MKIAIELIAQEREEQIFKHNRPISRDVVENTEHQLSSAASILCLHESKYGCNTVEDFIVDFCPAGWVEEIWEKMLRKPYKERIVIAAALLAAELDRLQATEDQTDNAA